MFGGGAGGVYQLGCDFVLGMRAFLVKLRLGGRAAFPE
jgi:hypothetical protein